MQNDVAAVLQGNSELEQAALRRLDQLSTADGVDHRWLSIARTQIEQGFMAMNRAVAEAGMKRLAALLQEG